MVLGRSTLAFAAEGLPLLSTAGCGGPAPPLGLPGSTAEQTSTLPSLANQARSQPRRWGATSFAAVNAWLASPGHCPASMGPRHRDLDAGVAGPYRTLDFGAPR